MYKKQEYTNYLKVAAYCRDVFTGSHTAVKYLQRFTKENDDRWKDRQDRLTLDNFTRRTVEGVRNIVFRKDLNLALITNPSLLEIFESIDLIRNLNSFAKELLVASLRDGFTFILVDAPRFEETLTRADEIARGIRPYFVHILRENLINWKENADGSYEFVVIREFYSEWNGLEETVKEQFKIIYADRVEIIREEKLYQTFPNNLGVVPIVKLGESLIPHIYDLAKLNINHMNKNSELDYCLRIAASPIPVTYQMTRDSGAVVTVGVNDGLAFDAPRNEAGFEWVALEAKNTEALENRIKAIEEQMLNISVTFASSNKVKTATQVEKDATEDESLLVHCAAQLEEALNKAVKLLGLYNSTLALAKDQKVQVNRDYDSNKLSSEQITAYVGLYTAGIISLDTLWEILEQGEAIFIQDKEAEKLRIERVVQ